MAQTTREHLIDVGLKRIHAAGYGATGIAEILDLAEVPKGSFYHHFASKEAFAEAVLLRYAAGEVSRCESLLGDTNIAPLKRLRSYFKDLIKVYGRSGPISGCLLGNMSLEVADHSGSIQPLLRDVFGVWEEAIASVLREALNAGDLPRSAKPKELAAFILNNWEGAQVRSKADKSDEPFELFLHYTFDVLLKQ